MAELKHTWWIYLRLLSIQVRSQLEYRTSFLFDLLATGMGVAINFGSLVLIFQRFDNIGGWQLGEVAFLYGMVEMAFGTMDLIFSGFDPGTFGQQIRRGMFDQLMLRPIGLTVQVLGSSLQIRRLGRIAQGVFIFAVALARLDLHWTLGKVLYLPVVYLSLIGFFGALFVIGATITFWTVQPIEVVNIFTYGGCEMMSYPMHIFPNWMRRFFTYILPAIFLNYYPALYFLDKADPLHMPRWVSFLSPVVGAGIFIGALGFWQFGIQHYKSTGT